MTLVKYEQLIAYMGGGFEATPDQEGIIRTVILPGIQQELENHLARPVEPVIVREGVRADDFGFLWFRVTPIHEIYSVTRSDGTDVFVPSTPPPALPDNPDDWRVYDEYGDPDLFGYQLSPYSGGYSGYPVLGMPTTYRAVYLGGYNGYVNEALVLDILRVTARETEMQFDDTMSLRGGATEAASDSDVRLKGWEQSELTKWDRLRRRVTA